MLRALKPCVFMLCLLPFAVLLWAALNNRLGPDPGEKLMLETGAWAVRMLIATLLVSPLRSFSGWVSLLRLRRMLGLFCFRFARIASKIPKAAVWACSTALVGVSPCTAHPRRARTRAT